MSHRDANVETAVQTADIEAPAGNRKKLFLALAGVVAMAGLAYGTYWQFIGSRYVSTDNAYTAAEIAQVTPSVGGTVREVKVVDTQHVKQGEVLVVIDDTDAKLALAQAEAELGRAQRKVRGYQANDEGLSAQVNARAADEKQAAAQLASAQADLERAGTDLRRREALAKSGSVSGEELSNARTTFATASAKMEAAQAAVEQTRANRAAALGNQRANAVLISDTTVDTNPEVALARAKRDQARVDLARTLLRAPVDGVVAKRQVQIGQRIAAGATLLSVVPVQNVHVDANFKEGQLGKVKLGQSVSLKADLYGSSVEYHGTVVGLSGGTGSAFAMIPAQNATGNWIKVVQRLPVRIAINADELQARPLQVGLSMEVEVDTHTEPAIKTASRY
ncbi:HlyD family efflux transporter periplasmic adaptor subunit [Chitinimonas naiadis]